MLGLVKLNKKQLFPLKNYLHFYITPSGNYLLKVGVRQTRVSSIFATLVL